MVKLSKQKLDDIKGHILKKKSVRKISKLTAVPKTQIGRIAQEMGVTTEGTIGRPRKLSGRAVTNLVTQITTQSAKTAQSLVKNVQNDLYLCAPHHNC